VWRRFKARGDNGDANDTKATIVRIVRLRANRAALLGFESHAHWRMADTMAGHPDAAHALLLRVWRAAVGQVRREVADMQVVAARNGGPPSLEPWDYLYYAERVRKDRFDVDQADLER
jgi:peptidyl-dipeptidase Dcp